MTAPIGRISRALLALLEMLFVRLIWRAGIARLARDPSPKNILVFGYMGIGDLLLFIPTLKALKKNFPDCRVTLLTGPYSGAPELARAITEIDEIINIDWVKASFFEKIKINRQLRALRFDTVIATYTAPIRFFLTGLSKVPLRTGHCRNIAYPQPWKSPFGYLKWRFQFEFMEEEFFKRLFFNKKVFIGQGPVHEMDKGLKLIEALLPGKSFEKTIELNIPRQAGLKSSDNLIAMHITASIGQRWKQWPLDRYQLLCQKILKDWPIKLVFLGTTGEQELAKNLLNALDADRIVNFMGKTSVLEAAALLKNCVLFIGGDSGLGHLSIAVGTPTIRIFGPSDQPGYAAWQGTRHADITLDLECRPCLVSGLLRPGVLNYANCPHKNCLNQLSVELVYQQVSQRLARLGVKNF